MLEVKQLEPSSQYNLDNKFSGGGYFVANYLVWSIPININTERWWDTTTCPILSERSANCYLLIQAFPFGLIEKITFKWLKWNLSDHTNWSTIETSDGWSIYNSLIF